MEPYFSLFRRSGSVSLKKEPITEEEEKNGGKLKISNFKKIPKEWIKEESIFDNDIVFKTKKRGGGSFIYSISIRKSIIVLSLKYFKLITINDNVSKDDGQFIAIKIDASNFKKKHKKYLESPATGFNNGKDLTDLAIGYSIIGIDDVKSTIYNLTSSTDVVKLLKSFVEILLKSDPDNAIKLRTSIHLDNSLLLFAAIEAGFGSPVMLLNDNAIEFTKGNDGDDKISSFVISLGIKAILANNKSSAANIVFDKQELYKIHNNGDSKFLDNNNFIVVVNELYFSDDKTVLITCDDGFCELKPSKEYSTFKCFLKAVCKAEENFVDHIDGPIEIEDRVNNLLSIGLKRKGIAASLGDVISSIEDRDFAGAEYLRSVKKAFEIITSTEINNNLYIASFSDW